MAKITVPKASSATHTATRVQTCDCRHEAQDAVCGKLKHV